LLAGDKVIDHPGRSNAVDRDRLFQPIFLGSFFDLAAAENIEAVGDAGILYTDEKDLAYKLQRVLRDGSLVHAYRKRAQARAREHYTWDRVVDQYEQLFAEMAGISIPRDTEHVPTEVEIEGAAVARKV
jgi:hypothetical protein